jgi:hypothetical protein
MATKGRRASTKGNTRQAGEATKEEAEFHGDGRKNAITYADAYSYHFDAPFINILRALPSKDVVVNDRVRYLLVLVILGLLYGWIVSIIDMAYTVHLDHIWNVQVWFNVRLAAFIIAGALVFLVVATAMHLSGPLDGYDYKTYAYLWHTLNTLALITFVMLVAAGFCWGQAFVIRRARNATGTDLVTYLTGGGTPGTDPYTTDQATSCFGLYVAFNIFGFIVYSFGMLTLYQYFVWVQNNEP